MGVNKAQFDNGDGTFDYEGYQDALDEYGDQKYQEWKDETSENDNLTNTEIYGDEIPRDDSPTASNISEKEPKCK